MPKKMSDSTASIAGSDDELERRFRVARKAFVAKCRCPFCGQSSWHMDDGLVALPEPGAPLAVLSHRRVTRVKRTNLAYEFTCLSCGFVALFRQGYGTIHDTLFPGWR